MRREWRVHLIGRVSTRERGERGEKHLSMESREEEEYEEEM